MAKTAISTKKLIREEKKALKKTKNTKKSKEEILEKSDSDNDIRAKRKKNIALEKQQQELRREQYLKENGMVEAIIPVKLQQRFLYYTTTVKKLEKKTHRLKIILTFFVIAGIAFASLYMYERGEVQRTYQHMCNRAIEDTVDTIEGYQKNPTDSEKFSRMLTGEINTVRMTAEELGVDSKYTNQLNDIYYMMVNYPQQMEKHYDDLEAIYKILNKNITDHNAYKKIEQLSKSIDRLGK